MKRKPLIRHLVRLYAILAVVSVVTLAVSTFLLGQALHSHEARVALPAIAMAALAIAAAVHIVKRATAPLKQLRPTLEAFVNDEVRPPFPQTGIEEVDILIRKLNNMAAQLHERIETITLQHDELSAVLSSMQEGVIVLDLKDRVTRMNGFAAQLFRVDAARCVGRPLSEILRHIDLLNLLTQVTDDTGAETEIYQPDTDRYFHVRAGALRSPEGERQGLLLMINDITTLRKGDVMRRDFVANVSHELRTPITSILGSIETLREGAIDIPDDRSRFLDMAGRQATRLQAIVDDLLALAAIEDGTTKHSLERTTVPVAPLIEHVIQTALPLAQSKRITLTRTCDEAIQASLSPHLIERAISNLVHNAIQYSGEGATVSVNAYMDHQTLLIHVQDNGPGIEQKHLPRLFERFYRVDKSRSRHIGGTGLGLAIVKHIAIAHQGAVSVESDIGHGSTFTITIPPPA